MAIEDEIINISDIDVGTEILNNDRLIIETNSGTKLLAFKDLVIGEDNITFKDKLVQGANATGESSTRYSSVTGFNILTSDTTAGHITKYSDVSGSIELGKFNYTGITKFAELSAVIEENNSEIATLKENLATITTLLRSTSALSAVSVTTKSVNFKLTNTGDVEPSNTTLGFDGADLDASSTNSGVTFSLNPFSITYPEDGSYMASWQTYIGRLQAKYGAHGRTVTVYVNNDPKLTGTFERDGRGPFAYADINTMQYINPGDVLKLITSKRVELLKGSTFAGVKLG